MSINYPYQREIFTLNKSVVNYLPRCTYHLLYCPSHIKYGPPCPWHFNNTLSQLILVFNLSSIGLGFLNPKFRLKCLDMTSFCMQLENTEVNNIKLSRGEICVANLKAPLRMVHKLPYSLRSLGDNQECVHQKRDAFSLSHYLCSHKGNK